MFSRQFVRYIKRNRFSIPAYNFRYDPKNVDTEENYLPPTYPIEDDKIQVKRRVKKMQKGIVFDKSDLKNNLETPAKISLKNSKFTPSVEELKHLKMNDNPKSVVKMTENRKLPENIKLEGKYSNFSSHKRFHKKSFEPKGEMIFGIHPTFLSLQAKRRVIHQLYYKRGLETTNVKIGEILDLAKQCDIEVEPVKLSQLKWMVGEDRVHQGICCDVGPLPFGKLHFNSLSLPADVKEEQNCEGRPYQLWLYMDRIQDPMNFGAILRSAYFMGVDRVLTSNQNSCRLSGIVSKASAGAAEIFPVYQVDDLKNYLQMLDHRGWNLVSTAADSLNSPVPLSHFTPEGNTLVAIGNEGLGISPELQELFKTTITIKAGRTLRPGLDSLNVSVATAVILHNLTAKLSALGVENKKSR